MTACETIPQLLLRAADRNSHGVWLRTDVGTLSIGDAVGHVAYLAERLREAGIHEGHLVVLTARTSPPYLLCWLALTSIGAIAVPTDPASTAGELSGLVGQVQPRALVTDAELLPGVTESGAVSQSDLGVLDIASLLGDWTQPPTAPPALRTSVTADDLAILIPTSGTTGKSKLVMQTHRAFAWAGEGFPFWMGLNADDRLMTSLPLFHINAPAYSVLGSLSCGAGLILLPRFSGSGFLDAARRHGATEFNAIGAMLEILMRQPPRPDDADSDLRLCYTGPSPTREFQEAFEKRFGLRVVCGYGLSESPYGLFWRHGTRPFGSLGSPRQHPTLGTVNEVRVIDDEGQDVPTGGSGELLLRNPVVTPGYWRMPDQTAATVVDGWLHTGDVVTVDGDDTYTFVARKKEVLRRRGQNMSPAEIEDAIVSHPDVVEAAVVAVPSELTEDEVKAFLVYSPDRLPDFDELRQWTAAQLSAFKVPRFWQAVDSLPRTPTQRIAKHKLPSGHPADEHDAEEPQAARVPGADLPPTTKDTP